MCPHQQEYLSEKMTTIPSLYPETNLLRKQESWKEHGGKAVGFTLFDLIRELSKEYRIRDEASDKEIDSIIAS